MLISSRRIPILLFAVALLLVLATDAAAGQSNVTLIGTIRGGVYQDIDADGRCADDPFERQLPAPGIDIHFTSDGASLRLYSGSNGTYGLIPVTPGTWRVEIAPDPSLWLITSANPLQVEVAAGPGATQIGVDFCLLRISGPEVPSPAASQELDQVPDRGQVGAPAQAPDPLLERTIISKALLTVPPPPRPPENLEAALDTPVDANAVPAATWLSYLNSFRDIGGLSPLAELESLTFGSQWHSRYMVVNDAPIAHSENPANTLYNPAGHQAGKNGNLFATTQIESDYAWAINFWISAPFHLVPMIDPGLSQVGFGQYNEVVGTFRMAAVLDARSSLADPPADTAYPLFFPGDGASTWVVRHSLYEWPDPMTGCPGYSRPSGPPLVLQLGSGGLTPRVSDHALYEDGRLIDSCRFDESSYNNPDPYAQSTGRIILDERDAVVVIPRHPLAIGKNYRVEITANGEPYGWEFTTQRGP